MATSQLQLYNIGLLAVGERALSNLSEAREPRRKLDEVWSRGNGATRFFLEQGFWNFAMRAAKLDSSTSVTPSFGFSFAFQKPDDFVKLNMISADERFNGPLTDYELEGDYIYCDVDPLYLRYVSDDADWGLDYSKWPETFTLWAGTWLGLQIAPTLLNDLDLKELKKDAKDLLADARSKDAMQEPTRFQPLSSWVQARHGRSSRGDRGLRNKLIGS